MNNDCYLKIIELYIKAGTDIKDAVIASTNLASKEDAIVRFKFNSANLEVWRFSTVDDVIESYYSQINKDKQ
jgi:hypothetical protein